MPKIKTVRGIENRKVVSQKEWLVAGKKLLVQEKKFAKLVRLRAPGGLENLKLVEEDHPKPRPGELLVRIPPVDCWDAAGDDANVPDILRHLSAYDVTREVWAKCWERRPTPVAHPSM